MAHKRPGKPTRRRTNPSTVLSAADDVKIPMNAQRFVIVRFKDNKSANDFFEWVIAHGDWDEHK
jgi:hypothetical protein